MPWIDDRGVSVSHHRPIPQSVENPKKQACSRCGAERRVFILEDRWRSDWWFLADGRKDYCEKT